MTAPGANPLLSAALGPLAWLYGVLVRVRNSRYDRPGSTVRASVPVVSIGNLTVGGTGKTPLVAWLAGRLRDDGASVAIVSRGYGGTSGKGPCVVSRGAGPLVGRELAGDEPFMLSRVTTGIAVVVGSDRIAGARTAAELGADVVLLDDGFQHRRLARELDIVLVDGLHPFGNGRLLPAGPLREPLRSLDRADLVVITRCRDPLAASRTASRILRERPDIPVLRSDHRATGFVDDRGEPRPAPRRIMAFCGIGNPERFGVDLAAVGADVAELRAFRDHHRYSEAELRGLREAARRHAAELVTTEKDLARIGASRAARILALRIELEIEEPERLIESVRKAVGSRSVKC